MKKRSLKKRIIFISAIVVIIGALVYPTYKLVKYVNMWTAMGLIQWRKQLKGTQRAE